MLCGSVEQWDLKQLRENASYEEIVGRFQFFCMKANLSFYSIFPCFLKYCYLLDDLCFSFYSSLQILIDSKTITYFCYCYKISKTHCCSTSLLVHFTQIGSHILAISLLEEVYTLWELLVAGVNGNGRK